MIETSTLLAEPIPNGYSWTLASRLGQMLECAEKYFGARAKKWTLLGIEFTRGGPSLWFPGHPRRCDIIIQLGVRAATDHEFGCWQLAHEVLHVLSPVELGAATVLEEGLATFFQYLYLETHLGGDTDWLSQFPLSDRRYEAARNGVRRLIEAGGGMDKTFDMLREARSCAGGFSAIDEGQLKALLPNLPAELAQELVSPFYVR